MYTSPYNRWSFCIILYIHFHVYLHMQHTLFITYHLSYLYRAQRMQKLQRSIDKHPYIMEHRDQSKDGHSTNLWYHVLISRRKLIPDTVATSVESGVSKACCEKGLEHMEERLKQASLRRQYLWRKLMSAYAFVDLTEEERQAFQSKGKMWVEIQSYGRLGGCGRIASLKSLFRRLRIKERMANNECEECIHGQVPIYEVLYTYMLS